MMALRCPGELTKDLTLKAEDLTFNAKDSKFVLEDISRTTTLFYRLLVLLVALPAVAMH